MEVSAGGGSIVVSGVSHNFSTTHNRNLVLDDVTVSMQPGVMTLLHGGERIREDDIAQHHVRLTEAGLGNGVR